MNIFDFALVMEKDSEKLYRKLANKTKNFGIKNILGMLADDEVKHFNAIEKVKNKIEDINFANTAVLNNIQNVIKDIKKEIHSDASQMEIYKKAKDLEFKSMTFYLEKSNNVESPVHKSLFKWLANEEEKHFNLIENLITHVSRPQTWVENAEFTTREEY